MNTHTNACREGQSNPFSAPEAFSRLDETDDKVFYATDRFVQHLDRTALDTVENLIGQLVVEEHPVILDLMAGWDSHLPEGLAPARMIGLGLNENELRRNPALTEYVLHDLNADPLLPFPDETFDVVLNTVSVDYLVKPLEVFREAARVLKPGGLFLVVFSNRMFPQKAVKVWRESGEEERLILVQDFFEDSGLFEPVRRFISRGRPRPRDDKYAGSGLPSDPVYAIYADRKGAPAGRAARPQARPSYGRKPSPEELAERQALIKTNGQCPYCGKKLKKWKVPDNPFSQTWDNEFMLICFNDECPYYVRGYDVMNEKGKSGNSYRLMYIPENDCCLPIPVPGPKALRESIVEE